MDGSQLTISPSRWMELPELSFSDWLRQERLSANSLNAGLVFSAKTTNFSEDNSLLNAYLPKRSLAEDPINLQNYLKKQLMATNNSSEELSQSRVTMHDVRNYYRDYVNQKNLDKYLLNNATVTSVRRICPNKLFPTNGYNGCGGGEAKPDSTNGSSLASNCFLWEVSGLIDKRDRKKASSLTHKGDLMEFRYFCKHLVLANGAADLHNELKVRGENTRFVLRSIRELEEKIRDDLPRLQKDPLLIVGSGLSAADAILLAQTYGIKIVHVIRRSVFDSNLIFKKLPKKIYPEYQRVYEQMLTHRYNNVNNKNSGHSSSSASTKSLNTFESDVDATTTTTQSSNLVRPLSQTDLNTFHRHSTTTANHQFSINDTITATLHNNTLLNNGTMSSSSSSYIMYDQHQVKYFTSKRTCVLTSLTTAQQKENSPQPTSDSSRATLRLSTGLNFSAITNPVASNNVNSTCRHLHLQKQHHQLHQRQLNEFDEESEQQTANCSSSFDNEETATVMQQEKDEKELKISYACVLIGFSADLDFLPPYIVDELAQNPDKLMNTKDNPIDVNEFTHETRKFKRLYAMGPLIGDNFVRFGTGGSLAITSAVVNFRKEEQQRAQSLAALNNLKASSSSSSLKSISNKLSNMNNSNKSAQASTENLSTTNSQIIH